MVLLHILLAVAFGLLWYLQWSLGKLQKAFRTQGEINEITKAAFDLLAQEVDKKSNKRVKKGSK